MPSGVRVDGPVPHGHWKVATLTAAVRLGDAGAYLSFDGAAFETSGETCLAPTLSPGDVVNLDNPACRKKAAAARLVDVRGWFRRNGYRPRESIDTL